MAMQSLRLRRFFSLVSSSCNNFLSQSTTYTPLARPPSVLRRANNLNNDLPRLNTREPTRCFSEGRQWKLYKEGDEITEDTVLFEGCDFNHWLITVDFPKDPKPSPEEMVATYERICAEGLNISIEEAKKKIYACSTTTYQGFQALMTEAESEKFKDVPGVVFVLPDSYIDPVNKEYGGDKYENGVITPRPPPYNPQRERRDRNPRQRNFQNYNQNPPQPYNQQGPPMQRNYPNTNANFGGRADHGHQQNYPPPQGKPPQSSPMNGKYTGGGWGNNQGPPQAPASGNFPGGGWGNNQGPPQSPASGNFPGGGWGNNQGPSQSPGSGNFPGGGWANNQGPPQSPGSGNFPGGGWGNNQGLSQSPASGNFPGGGWANNQGPPQSPANGNFPGGGWGNIQKPPQSPAGGSFAGGRWSNNQGPPDYHQRRDGGFQQGGNHGQSESAGNRGDIYREKQQGYDGRGYQADGYTQRGQQNVENESYRGRY